MIHELLDEFKSINKENFTKQDIIDFLENKANGIKNRIVDIDGVVLDPNNFEVIIDNKRHFFPKKEFKVLYYLVSNPDKCITRDSILKNCWEHDVVVCDRTIDVHICKIKRKLNGKLNIYTQKGVGYKWKTY